MFRYSRICLLWFFIYSSYTLASDTLPNKLKLDRQGAVPYREDTPLTKQLITIETYKKPKNFGLILEPIRKEAELNCYQPIKTRKGTYYVSRIRMPVTDKDSPVLKIKNKLEYTIHDSAGRLVKENIPEEEIDQEFRKMANPAKL